MKKKRRWLIPVALFLLDAGLHWYASDAVRVEKSYSIPLYPFLAHIFRLVLGWIPFSVGDITYGILLIWLLLKIIQLVKRLFRKEWNLLWLKYAGFNTIRFFLWLYLVFQLCWGLNYSRAGIAYQLILPGTIYNTTDLKMLNALLLEKVNTSKAILCQQKDTVRSGQQLFTGAVAAYEQLSKTYSFLSYKTPSVKSSLWGWLGNYMGFTGYYNPFTGEAQINTTVPLFLQPYTTCHEMAHQLGYAKEDEANFVGYLAAAASTDTFFHYSVYLDLFISANRNLYWLDSSAAIAFRKQLSPDVSTDLAIWRKFQQAHRSPAEQAASWIYGKYLQSNHQPAGVFTYDEVTGLLIEYYKKYGKI